MTIGILILVFLVTPSMNHPYHISVCDVEYNESAKALQVSQRLFLNDLEDALNKHFSIKMDILNPSSTEVRDSLIEVYVFGHFSLTVDGESKKRVYVGNEIDEDGMWCYFEYPDITQFDTVAVTNTLLFEQFEDQANIVHVKYKGDIHSKKLDLNTPTDEFIFTNR